VPVSHIEEVDGDSRRTVGFGDDFKRTGRALERRDLIALAQHRGVCAELTSDLSAKLRRKLSHR
jgi:hypothetical protein